MRERSKWTASTATWDFGKYAGAFHVQRIGTVFHNIPRQFAGDA